MNALYPGVMFAPDVDDGLLGRMTPFVEQSHHAISKTGDIDVSIWLIRSESGEVCASLRGHVLCNQLWPPPPERDTHSEVPLDGRIPQSDHLHVAPN